MGRESKEWANDINKTHSMSSAPKSRIFISVLPHSKGIILLAKATY